MIRAIGVTAAASVGLALCLIVALQLSRPTNGARRSDEVVVVDSRAAVPEPRVAPSAATSSASGEAAKPAPVQRYVADGWKGIWLNSDYDQLVIEDGDAPGRYEVTLPDGVDGNRRWATARADHDALVVDDAGRPMRLRETADVGRGIADRHPTSCLTDDRDRYFCR